MDISFPEHLSERLRWVVSPEESVNPAGEFVLYWMHNALRAHENPALDTAICLARQNGLPLLVYHGLSEDYPFASDRHHAFILQGHRDVQRELSDRGIAAAFHLQRHQYRGPYLRDLTRSAAVLVTEEMPVQPLSGWIQRLTIKSKTPIATVDCSCIAPAPLVDRGYTRASEFRRRVQPLHDERLGRTYHDQPADVQMVDVDAVCHAVGLQPMCLQDADLANLIGQCRIDHAIAPVADTPGGSRAGYARWEAFKREGLKSYSRSRNNPALPQGSSRMSAYLHYGMVSPFRIAREASAAGATKYLDELLVWRELAFHFCFHHRDDVDSLDAIPEWARKTLDQHAEDQRERDCSWETLARGQTGHALWDAAQRSLLKHGELHNNIRMTWGKSLLNWLSSPSRALQLMIDLNHRYALDGRNPNSYGGILWCFGQFDRPFQRETPVIGSIRPRDLDQHKQRLDLPAFQAHVDRPIAARTPRVAVIGAGISGLAAARTLADHGLDVTVFDKGRSVGGRTSTRRVAQGTDDETLRFDHGAQYFTARDSRFCRYVNSWLHDGIAEPWLGRIVSVTEDGTVEGEKYGTPRYVGVPGMNAVAHHLAEGLDTHVAVPVQAIERVGESWQIRQQGGSQHGPFDVVFSSCPPPQTATLLQGKTDLANVAESVEMRACWAVLVADQSLAEIPYSAAFVNGGPLSWIANNSRKPQRGQVPAWVIHASADWSDQHVDWSQEDVIKSLLPAFESIVGRRVRSPLHLAAHRWRYAIPREPLDDICLFDPTTNLGICGDWCGGSRFEAAFMSGVALAGTVLRRYTIDRAAYQPRQVQQPSLFAS